jgi:hypothetical protein
MEVTMDTIQLWFWIVVAQAVFGFSCLFVGIYIGIITERRDQYVARSALGVGGATLRRNQ